MLANVPGESTLSGLKIEKDLLLCPHMTEREREKACFLVSSLLRALSQLSRPHPLRAQLNLIISQRHHVQTSNITLSNRASTYEWRVQNSVHTCVLL